MQKKRVRSTVFRFKEFEVDQENCAMKINTDGVLLGALAGVEGPDHLRPTRIIDLGTGTGVIALMLAQRFPEARVFAIEKDLLAANQAQKNFQNSKFAHRISLFSKSFQEVLPHSCTEVPEQSIDLIVSNPPFFLDSLKNPDNRKSLARHTELNFFDELLHWASLVCRKEGFLQLILPLEVVQKIEEELIPQSLWTIVSHNWIYSFTRDPKPVRCLLTLQLGVEIPAAVLSSMQIVIYEAPGIYTATYKKLLQPFLLDF